MFISGQMRVWLLLPVAVPHWSSARRSKQSDECRWSVQEWQDLRECSHCSWTWFRRPLLITFEIKFNISIQSFLLSIVDLFLPGSCTKGEPSSNPQGVPPGVVTAVFVYNKLSILSLILKYLNVLIICYSTTVVANSSADHVAKIEIGGAVTTTFCSNVENVLRRCAKPRSVRQTLILRAHNSITINQISNDNENNKCVPE
jgi:hypothetical protein